MSYEYMEFDGTEPKVDILKIYAAFNDGTQNPLIYIETICYNLDLPVDELTIAILGEHVYTPNLNNDFTTGVCFDHLLKFDQMTDYEGFLRLVEYSEKRNKFRKELQQDLTKQQKGEK